MLAYCVTTVHEVKISKYFKQHVHCLVYCIIQTTTQYNKLQKPVDLLIKCVGEDVIGKKTSIQYLSIVISYGVPRWTILLYVHLYTPLSKRPKIGWHTNKLHWNEAIWPL